MRGIDNLLAFISFTDLCSHSWTCVWLGLSDHLRSNTFPQLVLCRHLLLMKHRSAAIFICFFLRQPVDKYEARVKDFHRGRNLAADSRESANDCYFLQALSIHEASMNGSENNLQGNVEVEG